MNYGGIGGVIGHEIGHGFDDQGSKSDGDGVLRDWWTPADATAFNALTTRLGAQYGAYRAAPGPPRQRRADDGREHRRRLGRGRGSGGLSPVAERPARSGHRRLHRRPALLPRLGPGLAVEVPRRRPEATASPPTRTRPTSSASSARCATSTPGTTPSMSSRARGTTWRRKSGFASGRGNVLPPPRGRVVAKATGWGRPEWAASFRLLDVSPGRPHPVSASLRPPSPKWEGNDQCAALPDVKKPAAGDTSQRAFSLSTERTFPPRNASDQRLRLSAPRRSSDVQMTHRTGLKSIKRSSEIRAVS